ncbi:MAG: hypothetical protein C5B50_30395 [Verrucomicrobia bacterium]|nr:MAG: hypothetical protein C5B50_30395 [Verrucomicrobiota bacterium]
MKLIANPRWPKPSINSVNPINLFNSLVAVTVLLGAALNSHATPLHRADVAAQPVWVAHLDVDRLRPTALGQHILSEAQKPEAAARLDVFQNMSGIDPRTQIHGLTLYGTGNSRDNPVMVVYADFDAAKLTTMAKAAKDSRSSTYKDHTIYNWVEGHEKSGKGERAEKRVYAAIAGSRVIFGQREDAVSAALDVLDGKAQNLDKSAAFPELGGPGDTSFIEAAASKLDVPESNPNAAVLRLSKSVRFQVGEADQKVTATLTLEANSEDVANNITSIVQGFTGLMKSRQDRPEAVKLGEAIAIKRDGPRVVATLSLPSSDALQMLKEHSAHKDARRGGGGGKSEN